MDVELARWLVSADARPALAEASRQADPGSLAVATALRRSWPAEQAAAASSQVELRRRAAGKFGGRAERMFFTPDGLEQATRAEVAAWRASRFVAAGVREVVDLGCGLGADALAFATAGLKVIAVEADPATAVLAAANLAVYFSKARGSTKVPVDYTERRHLRKPTGAPPGFVLYDHYQTLIIDPDPLILARFGLNER